MLPAILLWHIKIFWKEFLVVKTVRLKLASLRSRNQNPTVFYLLAYLQECCLAINLIKYNHESIYKVYNFRTNSCGVYCCTRIHFFLTPKSPSASIFGINKECNV